MGIDSSWKVCKAMTAGKTCLRWIKHSVHKEHNGMVYWRGLPAKPPHVRRGEKKHK